MIQRFGNIFLLTTREFIENNSINKELEANNSLLVDCDRHETFIGNVNRYNKHYPLENVDLGQTQLHFEIIKMHFTNDEIAGEIVSKLSEIDSGT